jgi:glycosyltransferase involved in cell wall biosynthesis
VKVVQVHNFYRSAGGEDFAVEGLCSLLERRGVRVARLTERSDELGSGLAGRLRAFASGIHSFSARRRMHRLLRQERPDLVHVHNLFPLLSPSVLAACRRAGVPVVMTCHNYRLSCPTGLHMADDGPCELCATFGEHHCLLRNCRDSLLESAAYGLRHAAARWRKDFERGVTLFIVLTEFLRRRLIERGFPARRMVVIPNTAEVPPEAAHPERGEYAAYAGRISPEKGVEDLLDAAGRLPDLPLRVAGDASAMPALREQATANVTFAGFLSREELGPFYRTARFVVLPSRAFEVFPLVLCEAMAHGLPVIASRIGGLPEIVDDGETGLLFEPGDTAELAEKMERLWREPGLCAELGAAGRAKAIREFSEDVYYRRLMGAYEMAMRMNGRHGGRG